jgi:predicted phosphodiesterase
VRVAALFDVHGNLPALEAVLAEVETVQPDALLIGGDVAAGPMPAETLALLLSHGRATLIRGNGDRAMLEPPDESEESWVRAQRWASFQLTHEQRSFLAALPQTAAFDVDRLGRVLFCHGSPRSDEEIVTRVTSEERLRAILAGVEERIVVCGHTHVQFDRVAGGIRVVNAGSVGMPYEGRPGAYWALLGPDVELRRTEYDLENAAQRVRESGFPGADEFVDENILASADPDEASEYFENMAAEPARE